MSTIKLKKSEVPQFLLDAAKKAFPDYNGRKYAVIFSEWYFLQNYWSGGTFHECVAFSLNDGRFSRPATETSNPFNKEAHVGNLPIPAKVAIIEHCRFCGKDLGIRFYLNPVNAAAGFFPQSL